MDGSYAMAKSVHITHLLMFTNEFDSFLVFSLTFNLLNQAFLFYQFYTDRI